MIGSGVSIPQLNPSIVGSIFTVVNGVISQNFTISGNLEIYNLDNTTFNNIEISGAANLTFTSTTGLLFRYCNIHNCGSISLDYSEVTFTGSTVHDCTEIVVPSHSRIDANSASSFEDFSNAFFVIDRGVFNAFNTTFDNCPVSALGEMMVILQECILLNNPPTAVYLSGGGYYYGSKNIFMIMYIGICRYADSEFYSHRGA